MSKRDATTGAEIGEQAGEALPTSSGRSLKGTRTSTLPQHSAPIENATNLTPKPELVPGTPGGLASGTPTSRGLPTVGLHAGITTPSAQTIVRLGRYQIVERIATGGMAEVYLAVLGELAGFRTPVVLKKVLPHLACNQQFIDMFLDEARIASLLDHPNVVRIYEVGKSNNEFFLAMELVQGKPLAAVLRRANERLERLDPRLAAHVVAQAAAGLNHAHNLTDPLGNPLGLVHRDVSPQNILISFEGSVKVIDFGIARALGRISETQTGGMKGKFGYMSPEQAKGEEVDQRTDIFALGVVLWEATTGRRLFHRENDLATMRALIYEPIPRPSSIVPIPLELESIIMRAIGRNPKLRFQSAGDMAATLEKFIVSVGGASTSDLGGVMKGYFVQDHSVWQQTLRTAVNLPAFTEGELATPVSGVGTVVHTSPSTTSLGMPAVQPVPTVAPARHSLRLMLVACIAAALAVGAVLLVRKGDDPAPPPVAAPAPIRPMVTPTAPEITPQPSAPSSPATANGDGRLDRNATKPKTEGRKRTAAPGRTKPKAPSNKVDRRPNPF